MRHGPFNGEARQDDLDRPLPLLRSVHAIRSEESLGLAAQSCGGTTPSQDARPRRLTRDRDNPIRPTERGSRIRPSDKSEIVARMAARER